MHSLANRAGIQIYNNTSRVTSILWQFWKPVWWNKNPHPCLPHNQFCPIAMSFKQLWAILDLGQHYTLWDSISPFLWADFLLLYSPFQNHFISHTPHGSASLDYVTILSRPTENGNVFHTWSAYTVKEIPLDIIRLWRFLPVLSTLVSNTHLEAPHGK